MTLLLLLVLLSPLNVFSESSNIKVIKAYNKTYQEILSLRDVQKDTAIIFSVSWCGPCKRLKQNLELSNNINFNTAEIIYVISDVDENDISIDGRAGKKLDKDLNSLGQTYWPFILLFSNAIEKPIFKFPTKNPKDDPWPELKFHEEIELFFEEY
jgi:thiol-disulfide isomerase/thioredoxin